MNRHQQVFYFPSYCALTALAKAQYRNRFGDRAGLLSGPLLQVHDEFQRHP